MAGTVNENYKRATFNTMIDAETQKQFSALCKEQGMKMNIVVEYFMKGYINGDFDIVMVDRKALQKDVYKKAREKRFDELMELLETGVSSYDFWEIKNELKELLIK